MEKKMEMITALFFLLEISLINLFLGNDTSVLRKKATFCEI